MPKYIPLLCSTPVVEALIAKRKTKTRRTTGLENDKEVAANPNAPGWFMNELGEAIKCPYGKVGDVLWVRETHYAYGHWRVCGLTKKTKKLKYEFVPCDDEDILFDNKIYSPELNATFNLEVKPNNYRLEGWYKRPSLFMPKKACRFFLQIKSITVEQLNDISEEDSIAEGVESCNSVKQKFGCTPMVMKLYRDYERKDNSLIDYPCNGFDNPILSFQTLWESINGKDSWNKNPWVWVIEFEQIEKPADFI